MDIQTANIVNYFNTINAIPRCSKDEGRLCLWLKAWAAERNYPQRFDTAGNLVVLVPASAGYEKSPAVVIQGHMDMVCEKTPESSHDFSQDPIVSTLKGDWITADGTTLGADNGIAIAYALALTEDPSVSHPPLELLFTVDEERGLNGVKAMGEAMISAKVMINLDSEDEGVFTIGCAGGVETSISMDLDCAPVPSDWLCARVLVGGLRGGHSGIDIHKQRGNANKLMGRTVAGLNRLSAVRLIRIKGGSRHNALARDAEAIIAFDPGHRPAIEQAIAQMETTIRQELAPHEPSLFLQIYPEQTSADFGPTWAETLRITHLLQALPHGVARMSSALSGLVETSCNLATVQVSDSRLTIVCSQRSSVMSQLAEMTATVHAVAHLAGAHPRNENEYPAWPPDADAKLLGQARAVYRRLFAKDPVVQVIHAGLECAIIGHRYPGIEMISFGPNIENAHSPDERLHLPSVTRVWHLLVALLAEMKV